jgi:hypothetical protein
MVSSSGLQEVIRCSSRDLRFASSGRRIELEECVLEMLVDLHDRSLITTTIALTHTKERQGNGEEEDTPEGGCTMCPSV